MTNPEYSLGKRPESFVEYIYTIINFILSLLWH